MAGTINDLYLKYVNKVGKTLENDRYFQYLFEMVQAGSTTLKQTHQVLHKVVDERWLSVIEESLDALNKKSPSIPAGSSPPSMRWCRWSWPRKSPPTASAT